MFYTSYFDNLKNIPKDYTVIAICGKSPDWYNGLEYKKLAPKYNFFVEWKKNHDNSYYIKCFNDQVLSKLDIKKVYEELKVLANNNENIVLICYEKPKDFCHRHLIADWFNLNKIKCEEFSNV